MDGDKTQTYSTDYKWFALGAPYRNEFKAYDELCTHGIKSWIPTVRVRTELHGRKRWETKLAVSNLLFAYTCEDELLRVKPLIPRLQFKIFTEDGVNKKVIVPEGQMDNFIRFVDKLDTVPAFVDSSILNLKGGEKVKVTRGAFEGVEGTFLKMKGRRSKVLCVNLGPLGSAITEIAPEDIQKL